MNALQHLCAFCFALCLAVTTFAADVLLAADDRAARPTDHSMMVYYVNAPAGASVREQYLYQVLLEELLQRLRFRDHAEARHCTWRVLPESQFGSFSLRVYHPSPTRRLACLRDAVNLLLYDPIGESDFVSARRELADATRSWREPSLRRDPIGRFRVLDSALRAVYRKGSVLHQLYSIGWGDVQAVSYDEFEGWLRRTREAGLISLDGERKLLESLGLPLYDRMILRMVLSLDFSESPGRRALVRGRRKVWNFGAYLAEDASRRRS